MNSNLHIGNLIHDVLTEEGRKPSWLAKKLHYDNSNIYRIFKNETINTQVLLRISLILKHDFFNHYSMIIQSCDVKSENTKPII